VFATLLPLGINTNTISAITNPIKRVDIKEIGKYPLFAINPDTDEKSIPLPRAA